MQEERLELGNGAQESPQWSVKKCPLREVPPTEYDDRVGMVIKATTGSGS